MDHKQFVEEFLGIKDVEKEEDFKKAFSEKFIAKSQVAEDDEIVKSIVGRRMGSIETGLKKIARSYEIEFGDDLKEKKVEDIIDVLGTKIQEKHQSEIKTLKESIDDEDQKKALTEWEDKYSKLEQKYSDTKDLLDNTKNEFNQYRDETNNKLKGVKLGVILDSTKSKMPWKDEMNEVEKKGFEAIIREKYKFDLDDENPSQAVPFDAKTGKRIQNPKKAGEFMSLNDVLETEAREMKLLKANDKADVRQRSGDRRERIENNGGGQKRERFIHPRAQQ